MDRSLSPTPSDASTEYEASPAARDAQTSTPATIHNPDVSQRGLRTPASSIFSPSAGFLEDFSRHDRTGASSGPPSRLDMDVDDRESLLSRNTMHSRRHSRHYDRMDSWVELAKVGTVKLLITVFFAGALCICLKAWEGFRSPIALSKKDVQIFNALTIGLSLCLGLNLLSSLRRYAVILRWAILSKRYVSMEAFDLILGIEELTNVVKLMALSLPSLRKRRWLVGRNRSWVDKNPGTNKWYVYVCALWLFINIGSQVLVASLSLFWPTQPFKCQLMKYGEVAVADLSKWVTDPEQVGSWESAWRYGMDAQSWPTFLANESHSDLSKLRTVPMYKDLDGTSYEYRFFYRSPAQGHTESEQSDRAIKTSTTCTPYTVRGDIEYYSDSTPYIEAKRQGSDDWINVTIPTSGYGMITYISRNEQCADRCAAIEVLQYKALDDRNVPHTSLWKCENRVHKISHTEGATHTGIDVNDQRIYSSNKFAMQAAGAIGWTGLEESGLTDRQFQIYPPGTPWSPNRTVDRTDVEDIIMRFTIGAIAAFDDHGIQHKITINDKICDKESQRLDVGWRYICGVLAAIGLIQLSALLYLLNSANRAIVRDTSFFSTAVLLKPIVEAIGDEPGLMAMSGERIKDLPKLRYRKIIYGFEKAADGTNQIKVSFQRRENEDTLRQWPSGEYR